MTSFDDCLLSRETVGRQATPSVSRLPPRRGETETAAAPGRIHPGLKNTTPNPSTCPSCHAPTWQVVIGGFDVRLDPTFLDTRTELLARLQSRHIYQTIPGSTLQRLKWRDTFHIAAPTQPERILATHVCTPPPHPDLVPIWPEASNRRDLMSEPEF